MQYLLNFTQNFLTIPIKSDFYFLQNLLLISFLQTFTKILYKFV